MDKIEELKKLLWVLDSKHNVSIPQTKENIDFIADEIVKLFCQQTVVGRSEQLKALLSKVVNEFDNGEVTWETRDQIEVELKSL